MTRAIDDTSTAVRTALAEVCGARPPDWLTSAVCREDMLGFVAQRMRGMGGQKSRKKLCKELCQVFHAAELLKAVLIDVDLTQALDNALPYQESAVLFSEGALLFNKNYPHWPSTADPVLIACHTALHELEKRAAAAHKVLSDVKGRGTNKVMHQGKNVTLPSANLFCAALLCAVWRAIHGELPSPQNDHSKAACAGLWAAAGGGEASASGNSAWIRPMVEARRATADDAPHTLLRSWASTARAVLLTASSTETTQNNAGSVASDATVASVMVSNTNQEADDE